MKTYRVDYYKTKNWVHYKIIKADDVQKAIKKAKVKHIVEITEI